MVMRKHTIRFSYNLITGTFKFINTSHGKTKSRIKGNLFQLKWLLRFQGEKPVKYKVSKKYFSYDYKLIPDLQEYPIIHYTNTPRYVEFSLNDTIYKISFHRHNLVSLFMNQKQIGGIREVSKWGFIKLEFVLVFECQELLDTLKKLVEIYLLIQYHVNSENGVDQYSWEDYRFEEETIANLEWFLD